MDRIFPPTTSLIAFLSLGPMEWIMYVLISIWFVRMYRTEKKAGRDVGCIVALIVFWILVGLLGGPCSTP